MNFEMKATNILETKAFDLTNEGRFSVIKICLVVSVYNLHRHFSWEEKEKHKIAKGLFSILNRKFKTKNNRIVILPQFQTPNRQKAVKLPPMDGQAVNKGIRM